MDNSRNSEKAPTPWRNAVRRSAVGHAAAIAAAAVAIGVGASESSPSGEAPNVGAEIPTAPSSPDDEMALMFGSPEIPSLAADDLRTRVFVEHAKLWGSRIAAAGELPYVEPVAAEAAKRGVPVLPPELESILLRKVVTEETRKQFLEQIAAWSGGDAKELSEAFGNWVIKSLSIDAPSELPSELSDLSSDDLTYLVGSVRTQLAHERKAEILADQLYGPSPDYRSDQFGVKFEEIPYVEERLDGRSFRKNQRVANRYWNDLGYRVPDGVKEFIVNRNPYSDSEAYAIGNKVVIEAGSGIVPDKSELRRILAHEYGHSLGFCHSREPSAVMYSDSGEQAVFCQVPPPEAVWPVRTVRSKDN